MSVNKPLIPAEDPNIVVPNVVKASSKRAEEIHAQAYPKAADPPQDPPQDPLAASVEPPTPASATQEVPPPDSTPALPAQDWEHMYKSMKGRFDRSVEHISQLQATVGDLQRQATRPPPKDDPASFEKLITDKELSDYGPELLEVMGKKAKEEFAPLISRMQGRIDELEGQVRGTTREVVKSARQKMFETLNEQCPEWQELNEDQNFISWLQLPDRYSGAIRNELLNAANERNDSPRVLAFFKGYLEEAARLPAVAEQGLPHTPGQLPAVAPAQAPQSYAKVPLESLAAPGRAKSTAAPAPVEKPIISRAQVSAFYANKAAGRYTTAEGDRLEAMIWDAKNEGRIV